MLAARRDLPVSLDGSLETTKSPENPKRRKQLLPQEIRLLSVLPAVSLLATPLLRGQRGMKAGKRILSHTRRDRRVAKKVIRHSFRERRTLTDQAGDTHTDCKAG